MIEVRNIIKRFGEQEVLKGISAEFKQGKMNLIIGKSGSGKTVLIKCIVGLMIPSEGEILYDGRDFTKMSVKEKKELRTEIGMLFQGNALFDSLTVEENIRFPLDMFTKKSMEEKTDRVNEVLNRVNLQGANLKYPSQLSGGMQKRTGLARAIVMNPKYLFCDEPNSGLDPKTSIVIDELINEITEENNITTIMNTHDMNSVIGSGDNILFLHQGERWWEGNNISLFESTNEELDSFIFASEFLKEAKTARLIKNQNK
ncbi:MAG: ATP-binding cassette domain-containing protein [Bacteroidetes bacterium]|jgi:phospholipid/cholesterol/gamma-HCH transport system ATP-binding protein|nr:ATP-binding cassette domain-containing protein [Bacteroidota bacterium]MBP7255726.1 ATP-binding cassette domain-containing protein [Chitinophagales bacterium]MBK7139040.1 ATP-binding cassette domain-containing protein [Bacteroidota bacterium]MBK7505762.1 ATP-binding cassette domain-containing protein [Bacteroidota bacterium]MBK7639728.1 ATP-binding cassette domain-containing protein [Bacteroidota bacterium]